MRLFFGVLLLIIGVLLVFGFFDSSIFSTIFENLFYLWPFILILIGLSVLSNIKGLRWLRFINTIFIILFALALIFYPTDFLSNKTYEEYQFQAALDITNDKTIIEIDVPTVYLEVVSDDSLKHMISGTYYSNVDDTDIRVSGNRIRITRKDENKLFLFGTPRYELHLRIPEQNNLELLIDTAVLKGIMRLEKSPIEIIDINTAVLNLDLNVGDFIVPMEVICESAINNLDIRAPIGTRYAQTMESAINKISIDDGFQEVDYNEDLKIEVHSAINNFNFIPYDE